MSTPRYALNTVPLRLEVLSPHSIKWQVRKRNRLSSILSKCPSTLKANYDAIVSHLAALFYGYPRNVEPIFVGGTMLEFSTSCAWPSHSRTLPRSSLVLSPPPKSHLISSHIPSLHSTYTWRAHHMGDQLYHNNEETGMIITRSPNLCVLDIRVKLRHPVFHILFFIPESERHISLFDMPTLREAKKLAESYYEAWLKVKDDPESGYNRFHAEWLATKVGG